MLVFYQYKNDKSDKVLHTALLQGEQSSCKKMNSGDPKPTNQLGEGHSVWFTRADWSENQSPTLRKKKNAAFRFK